MTVTAVLLAAGYSRRFGAACKLQADYRGKPLVRHAADAILEAGFGAIAVICDPLVAMLLPEFRIIESNGVQSHSLRAGIAAVTGARALIVLGDMPHINAEILHQVAAAPPPSATIGDGRRITPPACFARDMFPALMALGGDQGAGAMVRGLSGRHLIAVPDAAQRDIDRPEDMA